MEIREVMLKTHKLEMVKEFYTKQLGLFAVRQDANSFKLLVGTSLLTFTSTNVEGEPFYHFAFNIPSNKFEEAKAWLKGKVQLNTENGKD
ncbi:VOC family protein [Metabacillus sp. HB246100]